MTILTVKCSNPECWRKFLLGRGYKHTRYCSADCARACTPRPTKQVRGRGGELGISLALPLTSPRKHGEDRKDQTE